MKPQNHVGLVEIGPWGSQHGRSMASREPLSSTGTASSFRETGDGRGRAERGRSETHHRGVSV